MIDEVLFMQTRLFRMFLERYSLDPVAGLRAFEAGGIWAFVGECYDSLHVGSDDAALEDAVRVLEARGVTW